MEVKTNYMLFLKNIYIHSLWWHLDLQCEKEKFSTKFYNKFPAKY